MRKTLADLHVHAIDTYDLVWNLPLIKGRPYLINNKNRIPEKLLNKCFQTADSTLIGLIDFDDSRADSILQGLRDFATKRGYTMPNDWGYFLTIETEGKEAHFIAGEEIETDSGHVKSLGAHHSHGTPFHATTRVYDEVISETKANQGLIFGDHVLAEYKGLAKLAVKLTGKNPRLGLRREEIARHAADFTAISIYDINFGASLSEKQGELADALGIPVYAATDSHTIRHIFKAGIMLDDFGPTNGETAKQSLKEDLRTKNKRNLIIPNSIPFLENYRHGISTTFTTALIKTKILDRARNVPPSERMSKRKIGCIAAAGIAALTIGTGALIYSTSGKKLSQQHPATLPGLPHPTQIQPTIQTPSYPATQLKEIPAAQPKQIMPEYPLRQIPSHPETLSASTNISTLDSLLFKEFSQNEYPINENGHEIPLSQTLGYWATQDPEKKQGIAFANAGYHSLRLTNGESIAPTLKVNNENLACLIAELNGKSYFALVRNPTTKSRDGLVEVSGETYIGEPVTIKQK